MFICVAVIQNEITILRPVANTWNFSVAAPTKIFIFYLFIILFLSLLELCECGCMLLNVCLGCVLLWVKTRFRRTGLDESFFFMSAFFFGLSHSSSTLISRSVCCCKIKGPVTTQPKPLKTFSV